MVRRQRESEQAKHIIKEILTKELNKQTNEKKKKEND